jgi:hypothetical protein
MDFRDRVIQNWVTNEAQARTANWKRSISNRFNDRVGQIFRNRYARRFAVLSLTVPSTALRRRS